MTKGQSLMSSGHGTLKFNETRGLAFGAFIMKNDMLLLWTLFYEQIYAGIFDF